MNDDNAPTVGDAAPDFSLMNQDRRTIRLADLRGKTVVLLFYPMDFSPTCTAEHCSFQENFAQIAPDDNTVVFGVNADHPFCHAAYKTQYRLPYDLLSDPTRAMLKDYGMFSGLEPFNCAKRGTIVIDADGKVSSYTPAGIDEQRDVGDLAKRAAAAGRAA